MNFKEYQRLSQRTCPDLGQLNLPHMVLGMMSEMNELEDAIENNDVINVGEECADQFWYFSNYCTFRNINFDQFEPPSFKIAGNEFINFGILYYKLSELSDIIKKHVIYGKTINEDEEFEILLRISLCLHFICNTYGIDIYDSLSKNIAKLQARYPDKFTTEKALNRDLDTERKILEGEPEIIFTSKK